MQGHLSRIFIAAITAAMSLATPALCQTQGQVESFRDITMSPARDTQGEARGEMRTDAREAAEILKITPMIESLRAARQQGATSATLSKPLQQVKLTCLWKVLTASQEVRKANAELDQELAETYTALDSLTVKRSQTINMLNTLNFMQGGTLGTIKQSMGLLHYPQVTRQSIAIVSFSTSIGLSVMNLLIPQLWNKKIEGNPNSLEQYFNASYHPPDADKSYLWQFLDSKVPGSQSSLTRREILVRHWQDFAHVAKDPVTERKLAAMPKDEREKLESVKILNQRLTVLHDLKSHVEEFDGSLYELHQSMIMN